MASHLGLIREGLVEGDWAKVAKGYEQTTGETIAAPVNNVERGEAFSKEDVRHIVSKFLVRLGAELDGGVVIPKDSDVSRQIAEAVYGKEVVSHEVYDDDLIVSPGGKQPRNEKIIVKSVLVDDEDVPPEQFDGMYHRTKANPTPRREKPALQRFNCEKCGNVFLRSPELVLTEFGSSVLCDTCIQKKPQLARV